MATVYANETKAKSIMCVSAKRIFILKMTIASAILSSLFIIILTVSAPSMLAKLITLAYVEAILLKMEHSVCVMKISFNLREAYVFVIIMLHKLMIHVYA